MRAGRTFAPVVAHPDDDAISSDQHEAEAGLSGVQGHGALHSWRSGPRPTAPHAASHPARRTRTQRLRAGRDALADVTGLPVGGVLGYPDGRVAEAPMDQLSEAT